MLLLTDIIIIITVITIFYDKGDDNFVIIINMIISYEECFDYFCHYFSS